MNGPRDAVPFDDEMLFFLANPLATFGQYHQYQLLFLLGGAARTAMNIELRDQFRWRTPQPLRTGQFRVEILPVRLLQDDLLLICFAGWRG